MGRALPPHFLPHRRAAWPSSAPPLPRRPPPRAPRGPSPGHTRALTHPHSPPAGPPPLQSLLCHHFRTMKHPTPAGGERGSGRPLCVSRRPPVPGRGLGRPPPPAGPPATGSPREAETRQAEIGRKKKKKTKKNTATLKGRLSCLDRACSCRVWLKHFPWCSRCLRSCALRWLLFAFTPSRLRKRAAWSGEGLWASAAVRPAAPQTCPGLCASARSTAWVCEEEGQHTYFSNAVTQRANHSFH